MARKNITVPLNDFIAILNCDSDIIRVYEEKIYRVCQVCGKRFVFNRSEQLNCSSKCSRISTEKKNIVSRRKYKAEWAKKNREAKKGAAK